MLKDEFGVNQPKVVINYFGYLPLILIRDHKLIEELYTKQNKYFDKHHMMRDLLHPLMGDSILMQQSNENWAMKRKSMSVAFYKEKLLKMIDIVKDCMGRKVGEWKEKFVKTEQPMDLISEIASMLMMILLNCAFGEDLSDKTVDYYLHSKNIQSSICYSLREAFHRCVMKIISA